MNEEEDSCEDEEVWIEVCPFALQKLIGELKIAWDMLTMLELLDEKEVKEHNDYIKSWEEVIYGN